MLRELTQVAINTIENCENIKPGKFEESEIKNVALEQIRKLNYGKDQKNYFWITDLSPKMLMHPYRKDLEGKSLKNYKDINGTYIFNDAVEIVNKTGEGYMDYFWQWPDDSTKNVPKLSYVKLYKNWGWIIGTGVYIDNIENELSRLRKNELKYTLLLSTLVVLLILSILQYGIKSEKLRKKAQIKLKINEEKFRTIFQESNDIILISNADGEILDINDKSLKTYGLKYPDIIGKKTFELIPKEYHELIYERLKNIETSNMEPIEIEIMPKKGLLIPVEIKSSLINYLDKTVVLSILRDATQRKKVENEVRKLSKAVEQSANMVVITDTRGNIEYVNEKFYTTTGYTKGEVIGKKPNILKSGKQDHQFYRELWETILAGKVWRGEICNKKKNGELYWESSLITPVFNEKNEIINYMSVKEDITDKKNADLKLFNAIIETEERERKRFAEDLHDELGPHLSGIRLYINELEDDAIKPGRRIEIITLLDTLVKEAIDKTRSISNQLMPSILIDYGLLKALDSFCTRINNTNTIKISLTAHSSDISFDKTTEIVIYRILIELINNTIKHANANNIDIDFIHKGQQIDVLYSDDGKGFDISKKLKEKSGLGLGNILSRLKTIDGRYHFESIPKKGVIFKFTFQPKTVT